MSVIVPGVMRGKRPAFGFGAPAQPVLLAQESFEAYASAADMMAGGWALVGDFPPTPSTYGNVLFDGARVAFSTMNTGGGHYVGSSYAERSAWGLPAAADVDVRVWMHEDYWVGTHPGDPAVGLRVVGATGAASDTRLTNPGPYQPLSAQGRTAADGALPVRLGFFDYDTQGVCIRQTAWDRVELWSVVPPGAPATPTLLRLGYPLDQALGGDTPHERSRWVDEMAGGRRAWLPAVDRLLSGAARWIPALNGTTAEGHPVSGWEDAWLPFLAAVWAGDAVTFYPDQEDLTVAYPVTLRAPRPSPGEPPYELERDGTRRLTLTLESLAGSFAGY